MCHCYCRRESWERCECAWNVKIVIRNFHWPHTVSTAANTITRSDTYSAKRTKRNYGIEVWCVNCCKTTIENWKQFYVKTMRRWSMHRHQQPLRQRALQQRRWQEKWVWTKMAPITCAKYADDCTCTHRVWCGTWKRIKVMIGRTNWHRTIDERQMQKSKVNWKCWNVPIVIDCSAIWR